MSINANRILISIRATRERLRCVVCLLKILTLDGKLTSPNWNTKFTQAEEFFFFYICTGNIFSIKKKIFAFPVRWNGVIVVCLCCLYTVSHRILKKNQGTEISKFICLTYPIYCPYSFLIQNHTQETHFFKLLFRVENFFHRKKKFNSALLHFKASYLTWKLPQLCIHSM